MKFAQTFAYVLMAQNAIAIELSSEVSTCSMNCEERKTFVTCNFLEINYNNGSLNFTTAQKAALDDEVCAVDCEGFFAFITCLRNADHIAADEVLCMTTAFHGLFDGLT